MKRLSRILFILVTLLLLIWLLAPTHLRRAVIHGHVNIDDYKIFDNRIIHTDQPIPWQTDSLYNSLLIDTASLSEFKSYGTTSFLVVRNNKIVHEEYWDGTSDTTHSNSFSVAKSIVSLLIGCLLEEGKIKSLEQPVSDFLPEFKNAHGYTLRIKDLLTMSSGIEWDEMYSSLFSETTKAYYGSRLEEQVLSLEVKEEPGKRFTYQSCDAQILGLIVGKASGKTVSEYASEKLWNPLGAEQTAYWSLDRKDGVEKTYCCFNSTARDFARIGQMVLDSGRYNNVQIVPKLYIAEATSPATFLRDENGDSCYYYGYQFWLTSHKGYRVIYARGILGQYIFIIPSLNAVIVRLGTSRSKEYLNHTPKDAYVYLDAAFRLLMTEKTE
jgi:CubicO group peptidase (beta-lactamase class C family)